MSVKPPTVVVAFAIIIMALLSISHISEAAKDCGNNPFGPLRVCLAAITGNKPLPPSAECCVAVRNADLDCLCQAYGSSKPNPSFKPNVQAVVALVKTCKRTIPKNYECNGEPFSFHSS